MDQGGHIVYQKKSLALDIVDPLLPIPQKNNVRKPIRLLNQQKAFVKALSRLFAKYKVHTVLFMAIVVITALSFIIHPNSQPPNVPEIPTVDLRVTNTNETSMTLEWNDVLSGGIYEIAYQPRGNTTKIKKETLKNSLDLSGLWPGVDYEICLKAYNEGKEIKVKEGGPIIEKTHLVENDDDFSVWILEPLDFLCYSLKDQAGFSMKEILESKRFERVGSELTLPDRPISKGEKGYVVPTYIFYDSIPDDNTLRLITMLRTYEHGIYGTYWELSLSPDNSPMLHPVVINELLDELYQENGGWPQGDTVRLELYIYQECWTRCASLEFQLSSYSLD